MSNLICVNPQRRSEAEEFLKTRIAHPDFKAALRNINRIHATKGFSARGMMFVGDTGVGKTTILNCYQDIYCTENQFEMEPKRGKYPIVLTRLNSKSGSRSFLRNLCKQLGVIPPSTETVNDLETRAITLLKKREVELVMVDEFHHLASRDGRKNLDSIGDLLKNLMDLAQVPFVLVGTLKALTVLDGHPELQRRFAASTRLDNLNLSTDEEADKFSKILSACQRNCAVPSVTLSSPAMLERFLLASRGRIGIITNIIETAINYSDPEAGITMVDLAEAFDFCRSDPRYPKCNPFEAPIRVVKAELGRAK